MSEVSLPDWAIKRSRAARDFSQIDIKRSALLIVDIQQAFVVPGMPMARAISEDLVPRCNRLIAGARAAGIQVIFLRHTHADPIPGGRMPWQQLSPRHAAFRDSIRLNEPGHALCEALDYQSGDMVVDKYRLSAFAYHSSDLDDRLQAMGIDTLIISGAVTNGCCEATARDAYALGYKVIFAADATAALTPEEHQAALLNVAIIAGDVRMVEGILDIFSASE